MSDPKPSDSLIDGPHSDQWIVITSIADVTNDIRRLALLEGWKIVVVGDKKSPAVWHYPNCTFLSVGAQADLRYEIHDHLPFNSYARKSLGYLYAIQHGAKFIYDTDDDNKPLKDHLEFDFEDTRPGIRIESTAPAMETVYWNAYSHFGRPDVWPRGFPLQRIQDKSPQVRYQLYQDLKPSAIQQGLVNRDPDVDAVYRLVTYADQGPAADQDSNRIWFDPHAPSVQLAPGVYTPFNSQNTLFRYEAFWALYIPVSTAFRVCDIWRGYWALRLLAEIDESLTFHRANAVQYRNAHDYFHDYLDEKSLYEQAQSLVEDLHAWTCKNASFQECALDLAQMMATKGYWNQNDVKGIEIWFRDLTRLGYAFPKLQRTIQGERSGSVVKYVPRPRLTDETYDRFRRIQQILTFGQLKMNSIGPKPAVLFPESWQQQLKRIALVVVFNAPFHGNIPLLQTLYDSWFANTIFCSTFQEDPLQIRQERSIPGFENVIRSFSYIHLAKEEMDFGGLGYACLTKAIEMGMDVDGYLVIGDDVLLNFWTPFDTTRLNFMGDDNCEPLEDNRNPHTAEYWKGPRGRGAVETVKNDASFLGQLQPETRSGLIKALTVDAACNADIYYVPQAKAQEFILLANRFLEAGVFLEVAVPKIFWALGWNEHDGASLKGSYLWKTDRANTLSFFNPRHHFLHPMKMSLLKKDEWRKQFCDTYGRVWLEIMYSCIEC